MNMNSSCGLILIRGKGPKERDTRRFMTTSPERRGRNERGSDSIRPGVGDHALLIYGPVPGKRPSFRAGVAPAEAQRLFHGALYQQQSVAPYCWQE
jgi:hypothetical protein